LIESIFIGSDTMLNTRISYNLRICNWHCEQLDYCDCYSSIVRLFGDVTHMQSYKYHKALRY